MWPSNGGTGYLNNSFGFRQRMPEVAELVRIRSVVPASNSHEFGHKNLQYFTTKRLPKIPVLSRQGKGELAASMLIPKESAAPGHPVLVLDRQLFRPE